MPTALIADDEPHLARALAAELAAIWPDLKVLPLARHGIEAAERIARELPDIAFLDIQMPGLTGLEVAQGIEGQTRVVFVTAYDHFAVEAFEQEAVDYVLKPVTQERLMRTVQRLQRLAPDSAGTRGQAHLEAEDAAMARVMQRLGGTGSQTQTPLQPLRWIRASAGDLTHQIPVEQVLYFHADDKYTCVQTAHTEHLIRTPIAELVQQLDPTRFWQIHRSSIVNLDHLAGTRRDDNSRLFVRLRGCRTELPASRAYVPLFKAM